jgi:hypothetical protein
MGVVNDEMGKDWFVDASGGPFPPSDDPFPSWDPLLVPLSSGGSLSLGEEV